jgi:cell division protein FtsQ
MLKSLSVNIDKDTQLLLRRFGWIALLFFIAVLVVSAIERKEGSQVAGVSIEVQPLQVGESLINEADIKLAITRNFGYQLEGRKIAAVDVQRIEEVLETEPFILNADVFIGANNTVQIRVEQREPILRIIDNNGMNYYLDIDGVKMPLSTHFTAKVLVATGSLPTYDENFKKRKRNRIKDAYELTRLLLNDEFLSAMIEQIYFNNKGEITLVPIVGRHKVFFGKFENAADKLKRLKIFYKEALPYEGWRKYKLINLEFDGQVVCEKR